MGRSPSPHEPFVAFDIIVRKERIEYEPFVERVSQSHFVTTRLVHIGGSMSIEAVLEVLQPSGHGALDPVEGAVWRLEEILAKYVRPDKVDGAYLPEQSGKDGVRNWREI